MKLKNILILTILITTFSCSQKYDIVDDEQFVGTWQLDGLSMYNEMTIKISRNSNKELVGHVQKLNDNKYIKMFVNPGDVWVSNISRSSNFQFRLTETKIARELFGLYGLGSSTEYKVEFIDNDTIGLTTDSNPTSSSIRYVRTTKNQANIR
jgi:hypothetical protein